MNHFIKLLLLESNPSILLFGFCAPTEHFSYDWKIKKFDKKLPLLQLTAILSQVDKDIFLENLNNKLSYKVGEQEISFNLELRPPVLSDTSGLEWENNKPVSKFHIASEYWNLDKKLIIDEISKLFSHCNGRELRDNIQQLFAILEKECGIDFSKEGGRLGNFEYYSPGKYMDSFEIIGNDYTTIILKKKHPISEELIVNCAAENEGRWISDEIKAFPIDSNEITFCADEPMTHYRIKAWGKTNGKLFYASESSFIMEINIGMSIVGSQRVIQDPWTTHLQKSNSKYKADIQKIATVTPSSRSNDIHVDNGQNIPWRKAKQEGKSLCALYKKSKTKGAFVPKTADCKGEIDSFLKVREYIEEKDVKRIVLADPFFSVKSAAKLLGRISSSDVELNVITALAEIDPDTGNKTSDIKEQSRTFIKNNRNILHSNLIVKNILRGNNQAFHDRYLIRYFSDGHIDGFLLSNSLNSAGQSYHYVIAPLEFAVCLEVAEYLQNLSDSEYQENLPKNERVQIEILCSPENDYENAEKEIQYVLPQLLTGERNIDGAVHRCIELNYFKDDSNAKSFTVLPDALPNIIRDLLKHCESDPENVIIAFGEALYHSYDRAIYKARRILQSVPNSIAKYSEMILLLAKDVEERQKHKQQPISSKQYIYWSLLNGKAKPGTVSCLINDPDFIYYKEDGYWSCLYKLFWLLNPAQFMHTLEITTPPLMLSILIEYIALCNYDKDLYELFLKSKWDWMHDLGAEWVWRNYKDSNLDINAVLDSIEMPMQLKQSTYLLSESAFHARRLGEKHLMNETESEICNELIGRVVKLCNETDISDDEKKDALNKVKDCESASNAFLILSIARFINEENLRNAQLDRIINTYLKSDNISSYDAEKYRQYIKLVVEATQLRYTDKFEGHVSSKLLHWDALFDWMEPYLKDRDYDRWSDSKNIVEWDKQFLLSYKEFGHELTGKLKIYFDFAISNSIPKHQA